MSRAILLGEAPPKSGNLALPLSGRPARVLCELAEIAPAKGGTTYGRWTGALYDRFECRNLFDRYDDATPWRPRAARERVGELRPELVGRVVVLLGRGVQAAVWDVLGARRPQPVTDFYDWTFPWDVPSAPASVVTIPHPSDLGQLLDDPRERARAGGALRDALERSRLSSRG